MSSKLKTSRGHIICINSALPVHEYVDSCTTMSKFAVTDDHQFALRVKTSAQAIQLLKVLREAFPVSLSEASVIPCPARMQGGYPPSDLLKDGEVALINTPPKVPPAKPLGEFFVIEGSHGMWVSSEDKYASRGEYVRWTTDLNLCMTFLDAVEASTYLREVIGQRLPGSISCSLTPKTFSENEGLIPQFVIKNMFNRMYLGISSEDVLYFTKNEDRIVYFGSHSECQEFFLEILEDDTRNHILEDCKIVERIQESIDEVQEDTKPATPSSMLAPLHPPLGILDHWEADLKLLKQQLFDLGHEAHTHRYSILAMEALRLSMCISDVQKVLLKP